MTGDPLAAITNLAALLAAENAALEAADFSSAAMIAQSKPAAIAALGATGAPDNPGADRAALSRALERLATLAERNRRLLEHALRVQERAIAVFARAAMRAATAKAQQYRADGRLQHGAGAIPMRLSARI